MGARCVKIGERYDVGWSKEGCSVTIVCSSSSSTSKLQALQDVERGDTKSQERYRDQRHPEATKNERTRENAVVGIGGIQDSRARHIKDIQKQERRKEQKKKERDGQGSIYNGILIILRHTSRLAFCPHLPSLSDQPTNPPTNQSPPLLLTAPPTPPPAPAPFISSASPFQHRVQLLGAHEALLHPARVDHRQRHGAACHKMNFGDGRRGMNNKSQTRCVLTHCPLPYAPEWLSLPTAKARARCTISSASVRDSAVCRRPRANLPPPSSSPFVLLSLTTDPPSGAPFFSPWVG